jgi:hypothetical protein
MVNDGRVELLNKLRFVSDDQLPHTVELQWQQPQKFNAVRIVSGQQGSPRPSTPITDFVLQQHDGKDWKDIAGTKTTENQLYDWHATFDAVETARLRLLVTSSPGNLTRIWEIEAYQLPPQARSARPQ